MSTGNSGTTGGATVGQKVKGAFQTVHGLGESIRGNAMDFVDEATGTAKRGHGATARGEAEAQQGIANMEGRAPPVGTAPAAGTTTSTSASTAAPTGAAMGSGTTGGAAPGQAFGTKGSLPPGSSTGY